MNVKSFTFSPFAENTYVLYDDTGECAIVDPGCYGRAEEKQLTDFIDAKGLTPVRLINTHCHIDHIFGIPFVSRKYDLSLEIHEGEAVVLKFADQVGMMYGTPVEKMPEPGHFLNEGDVVKFGNTSLVLTCAVRNMMTREIIITIDHTTMVNLGEDGKPKPHGKTKIEFVKDRL